MESALDFCFLLVCVPKFYSTEEIVALKRALLFLGENSVFKIIMHKGHIDQQLPIILIDGCKTEYREKFGNGQKFLSVSWQKCNSKSNA